VTGKRPALVTAAAAAFLLAAGSARPQGDEPARLLNPFNDPFEQATAGRSCPAPLGPAYSEAERRVEAHSRVERGTTCWLAGLCAEPNAYRYDAANGRAAVNALRADPALAASAIWVTAQRRFVYLEGCVGSLAEALRAEADVKALADVDRVIPALGSPGERTPYAVAPPASAPVSAASAGARTR
jgi:hypothetical protein